MQSPTISQETTVEQNTNQVSPQSFEGGLDSGNALQAAPIQGEPQQAAVQQEVNALLNSLSEELRQAKSLSNFKDVNDLAKSYLHAQQLIGKRVQDMSPEDVAMLNGLRGVPDSSDKYQLPEQAVPEEAAKWYKDLAHKAGLTNQQAKEVFESYVNLERQANERMQAQRAEFKSQAEAELRREFGQGYTQQLQLAKSAVKAFGGDEVLKALNETGLGNHPSVIKMLAKIGENLLEDSIMEADKSQVFGDTPDRVQATIDAKLKDPSFSNA